MTAKLLSLQASIIALRALCASIKVSCKVLTGKVSDSAISCATKLSVASGRQHYHWHAAWTNCVPQKVIEQTLFCSIMAMYDSGGFMLQAVEEVKLRSFA